MIGQTLWLYLANRFARTVIAAFLAVFVLIYAVDLVELLRRSGDSERATGILMAGLSFLRTPTIAEQALPFAVLFGSMIAFLNLSRKMELVVARAAGVSVWQFLAPPLIVIGFIGILSVVAYNPASTRMKQWSDEIETTVFGGPPRGSAGLWIRQKSVDGQAVVHALGMDAGGAKLSRVEVFNFDDKGNFTERLDAASGELHDGYWELRDVKVVTPGFETLSVSTYLLATSLSRREVTQAFVAPETVSFWSLPETRRSDRASRIGPDRISAAISGASGPSADARLNGAGRRMLFVKIFPNGGNRIYGFRWRRRRVRALCCDQGGQRSRRSGLHQRRYGGLVARDHRVFVWRLRTAEARGWLMGSAVSFPFELKTRRPRGGRLWFALAALAVVSWLSGRAAAQSPAPSPPSPPAPTQQAKPQDKLVIDADQLIYDKDKNTVTAEGSVQLFYQGRVLQADRVVYNRATKRVYAEGHAKMTDEHGDIVYGTRFDLTDNFRDGFIESVQLLTSDKTRFSSPRVERQNGDVVVLQKGSYTACEPCKDHPERPPFWQVRATKIIENQQTHTIYFEDAQLLFWGFPVLYMPYFSAPDGTVNKQTGLLAPQFVSGSNLGYGLGLPYFINLAPNYDLLLDPTYLSKQGLLGEVEWRQRLDNGAYSIRATGIDEQDPGAFAAYPYDAGDQRLRGSIETTGNFLLNDMWKFGWDGTWLSDKFFLNDYRLQGINFDTYYFQDVVSSIYLRGQGPQSYFDLSGYHFEGLTPNDDNRTLPTAVAPVLDYNRVFNLPADRTNGLGGALTVDVNVANIDQTNAAFQSTGVQDFDNAYHLYNVCETIVSGVYVPTYVPGQCMLRGIAGDYTRATGQLSWQRSYIDPIGEVWKPFVFARLDGEATELNETGSITYASAAGMSTVANSSQAAFFSGASSGAFARGMGGLGLEYQYPFTSVSSWGTQTITPVAQFIARPNEIIPRIQPNEDSQSLVFDDTNLFAWSKFSGYDRIEGGTRLNYGMKYTADFSNGGHGSFVAGESVQVAGQNSYTLFDPTNTGLESGLDKKLSNFVAGETLQPTSAPITLMSKQQFDSTTFQLERFDGIAKAAYGGASGSVDYALYAAQPLLGWEYPREGLTGNVAYTFRDRWTVDGSLILDMSRHYYDTVGPGYADLLSRRLFLRHRLQGRVYDPDGALFVSAERAGRL